MGDSLPPPGPSLLELKTIYEGPGGRAAARFLKKTTLIVTNRTVEIEREGANVCMTFVTMGCWYMFFQTASIEIYEVRCPRAPRPRRAPLPSCSAARQCQPLPASLTAERSSCPHPAGCRRRCCCCCCCCCSPLAQQPEICS